MRAPSTVGLERRELGEGGFALAIVVAAHLLG
jgi:hypothetical protein